MTVNLPTEEICGRYIGINQNENAIKITQDRLNGIINQERLHKWI